MTILVVRAHPCPESYVAAVADRVVAGLDRAGNPAAVVDLYGDGYEPGRPLPAAHAELLATAHTLVLVHPTWWTSHPAIMLGWLEQAVEVGLPQVRAIVSVTTLGGSRLANRLAGESGARVVTHVARHRCPSRPVHRRLAMYGVDRSTIERRLRFLDEVEQRIGDLVA